SIIASYSSHRSPQAARPAITSTFSTGSTHCGQKPLISHLMHARKATARDAPAIAAIILPIIREAATYTLDPDMSESEALAYWMGGDKETFVAEEDGAVFGTYYMRPNQAGGGRHVCNCGYMTHAAAAGRGVARGMCEHSLEHARARGYRAMQFNFVVGTN